MLQVVPLVVGGGKCCSCCCLQAAGLDFSVSSAPPSSSVTATSTAPAPAAAAPRTFTLIKLYYVGSQFPCQIIDG